MKQVRTTIEINAKAEQVWNTLTDFESFPEWNPFVPHASGMIEAGSKIEVYLKPPKGMSMTIKPKVLRAEPNQEFRWLGHLLMPGIFDGEHFFIIEHIEENRVRFTQGERFTGFLVPFFGGVIDNAVLGFEEMNKALKERVEGSSNSN